MNSKGSNFQLQLSGLSFWLAVLLVISLLSAVGLGWVVKSIFIALALIPVLAIVAVLGLQWWVNRNLIYDRCPACEFEFPALKPRGETPEFQCPNCGESLKIEDQQFHRATPPGTIDVQAVDVSVKGLRSAAPSASEEDSTER